MKSNRETAKLSRSKSRAHSRRNREQTTRLHNSLLKPSPEVVSIHGSRVSKPESSKKRFLRVKHTYLKGIIINIINSENEKTPKKRESEEKDILEDSSKNEIIKIGQMKSLSMLEREDVGKVTTQSNESESKRRKKDNEFNEIYIFRPEKARKVQLNEDMHPVLDGKGDFEEEL